MSCDRAPANDRGAFTSLAVCCFNIALAASTSGHAVSALPTTGEKETRNVALTTAASTFFIMTFLSVLVNGPAILLPPTPLQLNRPTSTRFQNLPSMKQGTCQIGWTVVIPEYSVAYLLHRRLLPPPQGTFCPAAS